MKLLEYNEWRKFNGVINKAINACINSNYESSDHFVGSAKMIKIAKRIKSFEVAVCDFKW